MQNKKNFIYDTFIIMNIILNGISVGKSISTARHLISTHNSNYIVVLMLWLGLIGYTGRNIYKIHMDKQNDNNQKQR